MSLTWIIARAFTDYSACRKGAYMSSSLFDCLLLCLSALFILSASLSIFMLVLTYCLFSTFPFLSVPHRWFWRVLTKISLVVGNWLASLLTFCVSPSYCFPGLGLKRPYEDGTMDDKDLIKKMKRNLRKGTGERRKERRWCQDIYCSFTPSYFKNRKKGNARMRINIFFKVSFPKHWKWSCPMPQPSFSSHCLCFFCFFPLSAFLLSIFLPSCGGKSIVLIVHILVGHPTIPSSFFIQVEDEPPLMETERHL